MATEGFEFVRGDVRDPEVVERALADTDAVIHLAAITGAGRSHEIRDRVFDVNLGGTETVLDTAEDAGVERVVFASSCNVYGETYAENLHERTDPAPANPYAESKLHAEDACESSSLPAVSLRLATNFGWSPGVRYNLVVNDFVFRAIVGEPLTVYGDGTNWRPFLHVQDTARAFEHALDWEPGVYNVGMGNFRIEEIADAVSETVGRSVKTDYLAEKNPGPSYHVDFAKSRACGYEAEYDLEAGIADLARRFAAAGRVPEHV